jgi:serine/threonine-protein kinase
VISWRLTVRRSAAAAILSVLAVSSAGCAGGQAGAPDGAGPAPTAGPGTGSTAGAAPAGQPRGLFAAPQPWTKDVSGLAPSERSDDIIGALNEMGGWGNGNALQIDFGMALLVADGSAPRQTVTGPADGYCFDGPACDPVPLDMPLPEGGNTEGSPDYTCDPSADDCHLLVVEPATRKLFELYNATRDGENFTARAAFVWDLTKSYPDGMRGDQCTSADAAGFPVAGLLTTADEVARGDVPHALRFILPNERMKAGVFVHPAGHAGGPSSDNPNAPPYGVRFRLKAAFDESAFNPSERVVLTALKTHGMLLSDGGNIPLTFADDRLSDAKWAQLGIQAQSFNSIGPENFEVVDLGPEIPLTYECARTP